MQPGGSVPAAAADRGRESMTAVDFDPTLAPIVLEARPPAAFRFRGE
jgi:hypothetical protein